MIIGLSIEELMEKQMARKNSKQEQADKLYDSKLSRRDNIAKFVNELIVGSAYASTLYNNARKKADANKPTDTSDVNKKYKYFNKHNVSAFREEVEDALTVLADKYGINISTTHCSLDGNRQVNIKLEARCGDAPSRLEEAERKFKIYARRKGVSPDVFGKMFMTDDGHKYRVVGINTRAKKYTILCELFPERTVYRLPAFMVNRYVK